MSIWCIKLVTGQEIIGKLIEEETEYFVLSKVRMIYPEQTDKGVGVMLLPYAVTNLDADLEFAWESSVTVYEPDEEFALEYTKKVLGLENTEIAAQFGDIK